MKVLVVGQEAYNPWQQVYSVLRRLPSGVCLVSDPSTRVGEFARKAVDTEKTDLEWEELPVEGVWSPEEIDFAIIFWDPKDVFGEDYKEFVAESLYPEDIYPFEITPDLYPEQSTWAVEYITLWRNHGDGASPSTP